MTAKACTHRHIDDAVTVLEQLYDFVEQVSDSQLERVVAKRFRQVRIRPTART